MTRVQQQQRERTQQATAGGGMHWTHVLLGFVLAIAIAGPPLSPQMLLMHFPDSAFCFAQVCSSWLCSRPTHTIGILWCDSVLAGCLGLRSRGMEHVLSHISVVVFYTPAKRFQSFDSSMSYFFFTASTACDSRNANAQRRVLNTHEEREPARTSGCCLACGEMCLQV